MVFLWFSYGFPTASTAFMSFPGKDAAGVRRQHRARGAGTSHQGGRGVAVGFGIEQQQQQQQQQQHYNSLKSNY